MEREFVFNRPINGIEFKEGQTELDRQMQFDSLILEVQRSLDYLDRQLRLAPPPRKTLQLRLAINWVSVVLMPSMAVSSPIKRRKLPSGYSGLGGGSMTNLSANVTLGRFRGHDKVLYRREVFGSN